ncbi:MAG: metallophosphoesterase [Desulfobulbus sp.]|jgi:5'-nucleotidase
MHTAPRSTIPALALALFFHLSGLGWAHDATSAEADIRRQAEQRIHWRDAGHSGEHVAVQLLAINDFHGQISEALPVAGRPAGSAPVLAAYLNEAQDQAPGSTFFLHVGDHVGASQLQSELLQDEPAVVFFNMLGNQDCRPDGYGPECNLIGVPGNHELDEGVFELLRLIHGGNHALGPFLHDPYPGAAFPWLCANLVRESTGRPLLHPSIVREVDGVRIGFIGAILRQLPGFVPPEKLKDLKVTDEADTINLHARQLKEQGVGTLVVMIHQGGLQTGPQGDPTAPTAKPLLIGDIVPILQRLDPAIDVVLCGHTHTYHNLLLPRPGGRPLLVAQAWPKGTGYADINLEISRDSGEVVALSSSIITTWADEGPGLRPDARTARLARQTDELGLAIDQQLIARPAYPVADEIGRASASAPGDLSADSRSLGSRVMGAMQALHAPSADLALMHPEAANTEAGTTTRHALHTGQTADLHPVRWE